MSKDWRKIQNEKVINYLNEQLSEPISIKADLNNNYETYEELGLELMKYYSSKEYESKQEKKQLLRAKIITLESEKFNIINLDNIKSITIQFTIMLAFISAITSLFKDLINYNINGMLTFLLYIVIVFIVSIIFVYVINRIDSHHNRENRYKNIAINIHKSVIEEELDRIKEDNKQQENETNKILKEIDKTVEGTKREVETLMRFLNGIKK
ncbi:hypothetical protein [Clostridium sp.]|uniref:hypothetical protein n=1 Tax=Clostridium sp. TaxID=1506 RepID=UPI002627149C|nr:hypothetical protein [Clostridium sp.]